MISIFLALAFNSAMAMGPDGFTEVDPYPPGSNEMSCANYSNDEWKVGLEQGKLKIGKSAYNHTVSVEVADGTMFGRNKGEFGGELEFVRAKESQKIFKKNISALFLLPEQKVAAFGGMAHMGIDEGYMLVLGGPPAVSKWKIEKNVRLPANPYAVVPKDEEKFFFVTGDGLHSVDWKTGSVDKLIASSITGLYPNSIVVADGGHVYVGMRHAVAHYIPEKNGYKVKWLVKKKCTGIKLFDGVPH